MNYLIGLGVLLATIVIFELIYWLVHHKAGFINMGRISAGVLLMAGDALTQIQGLPWTDLVSEGQAKMIAFGISVALILRQAYDKVSQAKNPPAI
jgi:hypothetical protein